MTEHLINQIILSEKMPRTEEQNQEIREKTRGLILSSALRLFAVKGYHGTSVSDIARDAGVSKGLAYNYFKSKHEIVEAVFAQAFEESKFMEKGIAEIADPYDKIKFLIESYFDMTKNNEEYWRLYFSVALQPEVIETAKKMTVELADSFITSIEKLFKSIGIKNAHYEARMLGALFDGLGLQYMIDKNNFPFLKMKNYFLKKYDRENLNKLKNSV